MTSGRKIILVVEDHADSASAIQRLLELSGHFVMAVPTCEFALGAAKSIRFDLYIIDIGLPDGDGCELLLKLHGLGSPPAIALTGYGMAEDVERGMKAGFASYLVKPVTLSKLQEAVALALASAATRDGALQPNQTAPGVSPT